VSTPAPLPGPQLRDIHLPPEPSWWPPAPGWWLLAIVALALAILASRWLLRIARERLWRRRVHAELDRIAATHAAHADPVRLAAQVSQLLRRASRVVEPSAVAFGDDAWLAFLDGQLPQARRAAAPFRSGAGRALVDAPYRRAGDAAAFDAQALLDLARAWLHAALPRRRPRA
jgi:hypothetical protein